MTLSAFRIQVVREGGERGAAGVARRPHREGGHGLHHARARRPPRLLASSSLSTHRVGI